MAAAVCVIFAETPAEQSASRRTRRALAAAGEQVLDCSQGSLAAERLTELRGPVWFVRSGAWPARRVAASSARFPPPSATRRAVCALGAVVAEFADEKPPPQVRQWSAALHASGGDFSAAFTRGGAVLPPLASVYLDEELATHVLPLLGAGLSLARCLHELASSARVRILRYAALDVHVSERLRVAQVVTSLQLGGAERLALDLSTDLSRCDIQSRVYSVYSPTRDPFPAPLGTVELARRVRPSASRDERFDALAAELAVDGTDLVHAHLLDAADLERLSRRGYRSVVTVHNTRAGFPAGLTALDAAHVALWVGCSRAVEDDLACSGVGAPLRTVWNGIRVGPVEQRARRRRTCRWRSELGLDENGVLLVAVANPRPQKRLHLLPSILAALRAKLLDSGRAVKLVVAGAASPYNEAARRAEERLRAEVERWRLAAHVHFAGLISDVSELLQGSDVLLSPSEHEGLSLAQLEALALGVPVVATGEGGTAEVAAETPALRHLALDSSPRQWADAIVELLGSQGLAEAAHAAITRHFNVRRMTENYARLYPRALARTEAAARRDGIVLVTNNFSTGGAQSSARRLLLGLRAEGIRARAIVLQEQPEYPTPGRRALCEAGIEVLALPPPAELEPGRAVERLLRELQRDPPEAVVLWNVIVEHKILIADGLLDIPLFDVSPGEMYFRSLERYFTTTRRPGMPYRSARDYGARLSGVIVKYAAETAVAARVLGAPVHVVPNGVALASPSAERIQTCSERIVFGTSARIHPDKRLGDLLAALRLAAPHLPPHVLRIAGGVDGGAEREARELHQAAAGLHVEWLGELADTEAFLDTLDVFVLIAEPAGCPNASLEAMARGLPVIATDVGGMSEQVIHGVTGRLLPRADIPGFARALVELADQAELRAALGRAGRERIERRFLLRHMVAGYIDVCLPSFRARDRPQIAGISHGGEAPSGIAPGAEE